MPGTVPNVPNVQLAKRTLIMVLLRVQDKIYIYIFIILLSCLDIRTRDTHVFCASGQRLATFAVAAEALALELLLSELQTVTDWHI